MSAKSRCESRKKAVTMVKGKGELWRGCIRQFYLEWLKRVFQKGCHPVSNMSGMWVSKIQESQNSAQEKDDQGWEGTECDPCIPYKPGP